MNGFWQNQSFHNYADYAMSEDFRAGLIELRELGHARTSAIMCAEAVWWRCHRRIIADALIVRGWRVRDIMSPTQTKDHELTDFAEVEGETITYP